jgi:hypothetical protein
VHRAWAGSAGGQPGARSALVVGSKGGSGVAGVRLARAVLAVWDAGAGRAADVVEAGEEGWGWLPKCRSHLWFWPRTDLSWPQLSQYCAPMLARVRWPIRSFSCTFERRWMSSCALVSPLQRRPSLPHTGIVGHRKGAQDGGGVAAVLLTWLLSESCWLRPEGDVGCCWWHPSWAVVMAGH